MAKNRRLDHCEFGPTCVVYPEGVWYGLTSEESIDALIQHLLAGEIDEEQTLKLNDCEFDRTGRTASLALEQRGSVFLHKAYPAPHWLHLMHVFT